MLADGTCLITIMKILIKELKCLLAEGVMDALSTQISRTIINHIKQEAPSGRIEALIQQMNGFQLRVVFQTYGDEEELRWTRAHYDTQHHELFVRIEVPLPLRVQELNAFIPELKEALRHELEHALQANRKTIRGVHHLDPTYSDNTGFPRKNQFSDIESAKEYFLSPEEIEAHVMGMYKFAKTSKKPLRDIMIQKTTEMAGKMQRNGIPRQESFKFVSELFKTWVSYAEKRNIKITN